MNIVIEGPDASGKSTLAGIIWQHVPELLYTRGEGPPKYTGEMTDRVNRYLSLDNHIFDRHPCVSQLIYDQFRERPGDEWGNTIPQPLIDRFYASKPLFIYCYGQAGAHVADHSHADTPEHLAMIDQHDDNIRKAYHEWARSHVPFYHWYRYAGEEEGARARFIIHSIKEKLNAQ